MSKSWFFGLLMCVAHTAAAQFQFGANLLHTNAHTFGLDGIARNGHTNSGIEIYGEHRFKTSQRGPFTLQNGLRTGLQLFGRTAEVRGNQTYSNWLRLPVMWTQTMPRILQNEDHPLFEMYSAFGYYVAKPLHTEGFSAEYSSNPTYWAHGLLTDFGINFYIQTGSRLHLGYRLGFDLGLLGKAANDLPLTFFERGFTIGFSSSLPDTRTRLQALRASRRS